MSSTPEIRQIALSKSLESYSSFDSYNLMTEDILERASAFEKFIWNGTLPEKAKATEGIHASNVENKQV